MRGSRLKWVRTGVAHRVHKIPRVKLELPFVELGLSNGSGMKILRIQGWGDRWVYDISSTGFEPGTFCFANGAVNNVARPLERLC